MLIFRTIGSTTPLPVVVLQSGSTSLYTAVVPIIGSTAGYTTVVLILVSFVFLAVSFGGLNWIQF